MSPAAALLLGLFLLASATTTGEASLLRNRRLLAGEDGYELTRNLKHYELHDFSQHAPSRRALSQASEGNSAAKLEYEVEVLGRRVLLDLERHDELFAPDYAHYLLNAEGEVTHSQPALKCIYKGQERTSAGSAASNHQVSVALCDNEVRATVLHSDGKGNGDDALSFSIQPVASTPGLHIAYRHLDQLDRGHRCGNNASDVFSSPSRVALTNGDDVNSPHKHNRDLLSSSKVMGVSVVNDYKRYVQYAQQTHAHAAALMGVSNALFQLLGTPGYPADYSLKLQITSMYTFALGDPWPHNPALQTVCPNSGNCNNAPPDASGEVNATETLYTFNVWRNTKLQPLQNTQQRNGHDIAHLLTGYTFQGSTIGLASMATACAGSRSSTTQATDITDAQISSTITHEIAHNLGVEHTDKPPTPLSSCGETANSSFIMSSSSAYAYTSWEPCSPLYMKKFFESSLPGLGGNHYNSNPCMEEDSAVQFDNNPVCGDGLVQGDEECDCINKDCDLAGDSCCDGATCKLKPTSQCSKQDTCCDSETCQIITSTTHVCRDALSSCDIPETCDGTSAQCPFDTFEPTGTACTTTLTQSAGTCYHKMCKDAVEDCKLLGKDMAPANQWDETCSSETGTDSVDECVAYCRLASCQVTLMSQCCKVFTSSVVTYSDGVQCSSGKACLYGVCTPFAEIPTPTNPNCTNGEFGDTETDLDCGGLQCYGCAANKFCKLDTDCSFPGLCNTTVTYTNTYNNQEGYGKCSAVGKVGQGGKGGYEEMLNNVLNWMEENVMIWGPAVAAAVLVLLLLCCCPVKYICCCCASDPKKHHKGAAALGLQHAQGSFRNFRGQGGMPVAHRV